MASIASLGVGSGIDVRGLVDQLLAAEGQPKALRYDRKEATLQAQLSAIGTLKGALSEFQSSLSGLKYSSAFSKMSASSTQSSIFSATADSDAAAGSYSIEVSKLAEAHSISSKTGANLTSLGDEIGTGSITFEFGTWDNAAVPPTFAANADNPSETLTITDGSIAGIRDAINEANIGVDANIVYDGTEYRLTLTSETGAANAMRITVNDDDNTDTDASGLSQLAFDLDTGSATYAANMDENNLGQDAEVSIDGLLINSATNTLSDIIDGVSIDLKKAEVGTIGTLTVAQDTAGVKSALQGFVESFNSLNATLNELTFYDVDTGEKGIFLGDGSVRGIESSLRRTMNEAYGSTSDNFTTLATLGVRTQRDGSLELDESVLDSALSSSVEELRVLFAGGYKTPENSLLNFTEVPSTIDAGEVAVNVTSASTQGFYESDAIGGASLNFASDQTFTLDVDGVTTGNITLAAGDYVDGTTLAAAIQTQLSADSVGKNVTASYDSTNDTIVFTSNAYGSASSVSVASGSVGTFIGTANGASTAGTDVQGYFGSTEPTNGVYYANSLGGLTVNASNNTFRLNVDGSQTGDIVLTAQTYGSTADLVTEIQAQLDADSVGAGVTASYNATANRLEFTSNSVGTESSVSVSYSQGTLGTDIGIDADSGLSLDGQGIAATGAGRTLSGTGEYTGLQVEYLGQFNNQFFGAQEQQSGLMKDLSSLLDDFLLSDGILNAKTDSYNAQIDDINGQREVLDNRLQSLELTLLKKFGAMDSLVAQLNSTGDYLQGQFAQLAKLNK